MAGIVLLFSILAPLAGLWAATRLGQVCAPSAAETYARRIALVSIAVSPIYVLAGVFFLMAGHPTLDLPFMSMLWPLLAALILFADKQPRGLDRAQPSQAL
jgi:hypothetical protein